MVALESKHVVLFASLLVAACIGVGCKPKDKAAAENGDDPALLAQDGTDTSAVETDSELLTSSLVASSAGGPIGLASAADLGGGQLISTDVGDGAKLLFFPRGCLAVTHDAAARLVTYRFDSCTGPNGLYKIAGELKATYTASPTELVLDLVGTGLRINAATVDWSSHARIVASGSDRSMEWKAQLSGTTARGREFGRSNEKLIRWTLGERCIALEGKSEGEVKQRNLRTEIANYKRCQGACPEAGGRITITNVSSGTKVEITFDGSDRGTLTSAKGSTTFPLACAR